jgi:hypothetical protein
MALAGRASVGAKAAFLEASAGNGDAHSFAYARDEQRRLALTKTALGLKGLTISAGRPFNGNSNLRFGSPAWIRTTNLTGF